MLYINGQWIEPNGHEKLKVYNPANGDLIKEIATGGAQETKEAIQAAKQAFDSWKRKSSIERSDYLMSVAQHLKTDREEIAKLVTLEMGKPLKEARGEVGGAIEFLEWFAEEGKRVDGETLPEMDSAKQLLVLNQPLGVVGAITPWNFPVAMITRKIAPALAAGCTVVLKPAPDTPLSAIRIFDAFHKAGIPKGVVNLVIGPAEEIGAEITASSDVKKITFTGSTKVGKKLMSDSAQTVKRVSLELGGHAPFVVFSDADIDQAVQGVVTSGFSNAGQACTSANRIYVQEEIVEAFSRKLKGHVKELVVGDGHEETTDVGPLINQQAINTVTEHVEDAVKKGAKVLVGGKIAEVEGSSGNFFEPTVLADVTEDMLIANEETFGPVVPILTFKDEDEVLERANDTHYGLMSHVYTKDLTRVFRFSKEMQYGMLGINDASPNVIQSPFGGAKESGLGKEGGKYGIEEFLEKRYISIKYD